ncbi:hypothetical protein PMI01_00768 [Caulobacter sp. AP07]|uniref:hypothetical protein n=1 Tax=Caulobacter sp. AP07 TaxID=1144304 RepID=UPI0002720116|nr:hypothetical protein [Caulobacter sp. AP07]EJL37233.1 hypothetical protein PMI01_00768 [Caulobacter sp. AP07]
MTSALFPNALAGLALAPLTLAGALLLRRAWRSAGPRRPWLIAGGWALLVLALGLGAVLLGGARGPAIVLALGSTVALALVASGIELRDARKTAPRELALEPSERRRVVWRGWLRGFLAGPLAGVAALGCGLAVAICAPGAVQSRMVIGGLLVPFLWAGGMAWTLSDDRILRATAVLTGVAVATLGAAFLKGAL